MEIVHKNTVPFSDRLSRLLDNHYDTEGFVLTRGWSQRVARDMIENGLIAYKKNTDDTEGAKKKCIENTANTIRETHMFYYSASNMSGKWIDIYCRFFGCSAAYLFGEIDSFTPEYKAIQDTTGLSDRAAEQLLYLSKNRERMPLASEMHDTLNLILSDPSTMSDLLQAIGIMTGTVHFGKSGDNLPDLPDMNTADPAFIRAVKEKRLIMAVEKLSNE